MGSKTSDPCLSFQLLTSLNFPFTARTESLGWRKLPKGCAAQRNGPNSNGTGRGYWGSLHSDYSGALGRQVQDRVFGPFEISDVRGDYLRDGTSADSRAHLFGSSLRASS